MTPDPNIETGRNGVKRQEITLAHGAPFKTIILAAAIAATVFALDLLAPLGVTGGVPYVVLVLLGWWFRERSAVLYLAVAGSVLTILGYFFSPEGGIGWVALTNRALAILAIWATAAFLWRAWWNRARRPHQPKGETWHNQNPFLSMGSESFFVAVLVMVIVASSWGALSRIEDRAKDDIEKSLKIVLETSHAGIHHTFDDQKQAVRVWANDVQIRKTVMDLAALPRNAVALIHSRAQEDLRTRMTPLLEHVGYRGFFIIGKDNTNLASSRDDNVGVVSLLTMQEGFLERIWAGETLVSMSLVSDVPLRDIKGGLVENLPTMFVATPIKGTGGKIIAIFTFRLDPDEIFAPIFRLARFGDSGKTYAFNSKGLLISESRLKDNLRQLGLISGQHSDLNLEIRDPGVNMILGGKPSLPRDEQPFTRMAQSATAGESGSDLEGYCDYLGISVVGAWLWDDKLGFGIATEIDIEEAYASFHNTRYVILVFSALVIGVLVVLAVVSSRTRKRIALSEKKYSTSINSTSEGYWRVDTSGRMLEVNQAFCHMLGRSPDELLGKIPSEFASDETREIIEQQAARIPTTNHRRYEADFKNKLGQVVHVHINGTTIWDPQGKATGAFAFITDITEIKQVEVELKESEDRLRRSVLDAPNPIMMHAEDGEVLIISKKWTELSGYSPADIPTIFDWTEKAYGINKEHMQSFISRLYDIEQPIEDEAFVTTASGEQRIWEFRTSPLGRLSDGRRFIVSMANDVTERKQAEEELAASEARFHTLAKNSPVGIFQTDAEGHCLYVNERWCEMAGIELTEAFGGDWIQSLHPDDRERVMGEWSAALKANSPFQSEFRFRRGDGAVTWVVSQASPEHGQNGALEGYVGTITDITERKKAEMEATKKSELLETTLENMGHGFCVYDADQRLVAFNQAYLKYNRHSVKLIRLGVSLEDVLRCRVEAGEYGDVDVEETVKARFAKDKFRKERTEEHTLPDGTVYIYHRRAMPRGGVVSTFTDISELRRVESISSQNEERLQAIFDTVTDGIITIDDHGLIETFNPGAQKLFGYDAADILGKNVKILMPDTYAREHDDQIRSHNSQLTPKVIGSTRALYGRHQDGSIFPIELIINNMVVGGQKLITGIIRDISKRRKFENELINAKNEAESANLAKTQFLANMSHELRTPLNAIIGFSEIMRLEMFGSLGDSRYTGYVEDIDKSGKHLLGLINDILDVSKIEAGKVELHEEDIVLVELFESVVCFVRERAKVTGVEILIEADDSLPRIYADPLRLKQILINLLSNAVKFSPQNGIVMVDADINEYGACVIRVADTGIGIADKNIPKVMEPFGQVDSTISRRYEGTGLGLTLARSLANLHGASLELDSKLGAGTTVTLTIPNSRVLLSDLGFGANLFSKEN